MTFLELVQSKVPTRYLGARPIGFRREPDHDAYKVTIEGLAEPVWIGGRELLANGLMCTVLPIPCLDGKP